jgi:hypothetical protein
LDLLDLILDMPVGGEQIQPAIEVIIEKEHPERQRKPGRLADPLRDRFIGKQQRLLARDVEGGHLIREIADRNAETPIVLESSRVDAHGAAGCTKIVEGQTRSRPDLLECPVAFVVKNQVRQGVVGHHQIQPAIVVEIERRHPQRFRQRQARRPVAHLHAALRRDIPECPVALVAIKRRKRAREIPGLPVGAADPGN